MSTVAKIEMLRRLAALSRSYQNYLKSIEDARRTKEIDAHWAKVCDVMTRVSWYGRKND